MNSFCLNSEIDCKFAYYAAPTGMDFSVCNHLIMSSEKRGKSDGWGMAATPCRGRESVDLNMYM